MIERHIFNKNIKYIVTIDEIDLSIYESCTWHIFHAHETRLYVRSNSNTRQLLHRQILSAKNKECVDHINGNGLDNRRENLRICTNRQNAQNQRKTVLNRSSKYKGVNKRNYGNCWRAYITVDSKRFELGTFKYEIDAAIAYNEAAKQYFGEYARLNIIDKSTYK